MKRLFITAMLSIAAAGTAFAADLPQPMPAPQVPAAYIPTVAPVYNWGGIYVGINGGWGWGQTSWTVGPAGGFPALRVQPVTPAAWLAVLLEPISRLENSYSGWKAIGTILPSTLALLVPSAARSVLAKLGTIGWPLRARE